MLKQLTKLNLIVTIFFILISIITIGCNSKVTYDNTCRKLELEREKLKIKETNLRVNDLFESIEKIDIEKAKDILNKQPNLINTCDYSGKTALHIAVQTGNYKIVEFLISRGAVINIREKEHGFSPLYSAIAPHNEDIIELLISNGASLDLKDNYGLTPLHQAVLQKNEEIVKLLVVNGAAINSKTNYGDTPLHNGVNVLKILKLLISKGADVNAVNIKGVTPLHKVKTVEAAEILIKKGANINFKDNEGNTPLKSALKNHNTDVADFLRKHGAKE